jgi:two-component system phosphate regulon sensor histidine kinase PhoR
VVISSILFSRAVAFAYATSVVILFSLLIYLEFKQILPHYALYEKTLFDNTLFIYLLLAVFVVTVYVTAYICMTFMQIFRESKRKIDQLNEELIIADEEKTKFFRFTSHELKSPIIAIKTSIDGVLNKFGKSFDSRALDLLNRASLRAGQMLDIIKELIELSRNRDLVAKEKIPSDPLDLAQILKQVIQHETAYAEQRQIEIRTHCPDNLPVIFGSREDFEKIFRNLVNNAIRYTDRGGLVRISAECENKRMIFRFEDTGIGIPEEDISKIFDEFYRSENAKKIVTFGTGLGLSLTSQLLVKYNGNIKVKSKLNEGTVFSVTIPVPEPKS